MEGAAIAAKRAQDLAYWQAWHTIALQDYTKAHDFKTALKRQLGSTGRPNQTAEALAFFHGLRAKGVPVKIYKTPRA